jgi:DNA invertase Pin-like site-specific DNA recombinase
MATFAAYTRVSQVGDRGDRLLSPELQLAEIERWATAHGHELVVLDPELNESGGREDRPVFQAAIAACERGEFDGITVAALDRFSRSVMGALREIERIEATGAQLVSVRENIDSTTPTGRKVRRDFFSNAEWERDVKKEGLARARESAVARKIHVTGKVPLGYRRREDRILEPDPATAPIVRDMFRRRAAGESWPVIARAVSEVLGRPIQPQSVSRLVRDGRVYLGEARNGVYVHPEAHEPLVDRATFEAAQLAHPRPPRGKRGPALLSGIIRCAGCGRLMVPTTRSNARAYRCRRHHQAGECPEPCHVGEWIDGHVVGVVRKLMKGRGYRAAQVNRRLDEAERELQAAEAARDDFAAATAGMSREDIAAGMQAHAQAVRSARKTFAEARAAAVPVPDVKTFGEAWESLSGEQRRHVLRGSLGAVVVRKGRGPDLGRVRILGPGAVVNEDEPVDFDRLESEVIAP